MQQFAIRAGLTEIYAKQNTAYPNTSQCGSKPIDGIWVSPTLQFSRCGYLPFTFDHRGIWIDIPQAIAFGGLIPPPTPPSIHRLKLADPRIRNKYTEILADHIAEHNLENRLRELELNPQMSHRRQTQIYDAIDACYLQGVKLADKGCQKIKVGKIPFSPEYKNAALRTLVWSLVCRKLQGNRIRS